MKSLLNNLAIAVLLSCVLPTFADDPPLEGAPLMNTNAPAYEHTNSPSGPRAIKTHHPAPHAAVAKPQAEAPETNAAPQNLQSVEAAKAAPAPKPKGPGLVAYGCYGFSVNGQPFWVIPERYLHDLTNRYPFQYAEKIILPEP